MPKIASIWILALIFLFGCANEKPGGPVTTGLRQFMADEFSFKYATDAVFDIKGEQGNILRTYTITGPNIQANSDEAPSYQIEIKVLGDVEEQDYWSTFFPNLDENEIHQVSVRGKEAHRFETFDDGKSFIHTTVKAGNKRVLLSMGKQPWVTLSIYYMTLDSMRFND